MQRPNSPNPPSRSAKPPQGFVRALVCAALLSALGACAPQTEDPPAEIWSVPGLDGERVEPFQVKATAHVFVFLRTDCPISNRYAPELKRLRARYSEDVEFWWVYPGPEDVESIRRHLEAYYADALPSGVLLDPEHVLVRASGATITPEVAVFTQDRKRLYHGRIDDQFVDFGKARPAPTRRELDDVLSAVVAERPVPHQFAQAVGCFIEETS